MSVIFQALSVACITAVIGVGIWVGIIQTKVGAHSDALLAMKPDHDLLIRLDEKVSLILQKMERA